MNSWIDPIAGVISELWPTWKPSLGMLELWCRLLADLKPEEVRLAVFLHAAESQFPPTVADLRRLALAERGIARPGERMKLVRELLELPAPPESYAQPYHRPMLPEAGDGRPPATPEERARHLAEIRKTLSWFVRGD